MTSTKNRVTTRTMYGSWWTQRWSSKLSAAWRDSPCTKQLTLAWAPRPYTSGQPCGASQNTSSCISSNKNLIGIAWATGT